MEKHRTQVWLVNTGWTGGPYGEGKRIDLKHTRSILDAIHNGSLAKAEFRADPVFGFEVPKKCPNVPDNVLDPRRTWKDPKAYDKKAEALASLFGENFEQFVPECPEDVIKAGPNSEKAA